MVRKRKNSAFDRGIISTATQVERVVSEDVHLATVRHHRASGLLIGLVLGFVLNTVIAITLAYTYSEVHDSGTTSRAVESMLTQFGAETEAMEEAIHPSPEEIKRILDESSSKPVR